MYKLDNFDSHVFIQTFWQKRPCVLKNLFSAFQDPLDEHELAGLAQEDDVDSRIISQRQQQWQMHHGPFAEFESVCQGDWTLLVQSVDRYVPDAKALLDAFNFIPHWRIDDLMVSFSVENAGVGAHLDQYDVFIIQGKGKRRWQVGELGDYPEISPTQGLRQIDSFEPVIDEVLENGDVIYIPPGFPHKGIALEPCLNFSVGFRAPTQAELLSDFADYTLQHATYAERYTDPNIDARALPTSLKPQEVEKFRALMQKALYKDDFPMWLGEFLSKTNHFDNEQSHVEDEYTEQDIRHLIEQGERFVPALHIKPIIIDSPCVENDDVVFFIDGKPFHYPQEQRQNIELLLNSDYWPQNDNFIQQNCLFFDHLLTKLVNAGFWHLAE